MRQLLYLKNVSTLKYTAAACTGCGLCRKVCPHDVLKKSGKKIEIASLDACMECGACVENCPEAALSVERGVGCATAVINSALRKDGACCC